MNKEFLGERRSALEEEYFAKLNRSLIERLRVAEAARPKSGHWKEPPRIDRSIAAEHALP